MLPGISTACLYPELTEIALEQLAAMQVQAAEVFVNCMSETKEHKLREFRAIADNSGIHIISLHPYTSGMEPMYFFSGYQRRYDEGRELYKRYYQAANMLGAKIVVFHGSTKASAISREQYFERFLPLMTDAKEAGISLCQENVSRCTGHSPGFFKDMAQALPDAGFVFDVKQAVRAGEPVLDFAKAMGKNLRHVHISDHNAAHDCLAPGKGTFNTSELLSTIAKNGFDGGVIVELYRDNWGDIVELSAGYQQICTEISTLRKSDQIDGDIRQSGCIHTENGTIVGQSSPNFCRIREENGIKNFF